MKAYNQMKEEYQTMFEDLNLVQPYSLPHEKKISLFNPIIKN